MSLPRGRRRHGPGLLPALLVPIAAASLATCAAPDAARHEYGLAPARPAAEAVSSPAPEAGPEAGPETAATGGRTGPLELTLEQAALLALENNRAFRVERLRPAIAGTAAEEARAEFDTTLDVDASTSKDRGGPYETNIEGFSVDLARRLAGGTTVGVEASARRRDTFGSPDVNSARLGVSATHPVLRGAGREANLATLRQAGLDVRLSEHELAAVAQALVADVEKAYWDYVLAELQIEIFEKSLELSRGQLEETSERIDIGVLAEIELAAAQAEVALRNEERIGARGTLKKARLRLLRLVSPAAPASRTPPGPRMWDRRVVALQEPTVPEAETRAVEEIVVSSIERRPDLRQARLAAKRGELELVKTKSGLLPRLDLFVTLGKSGYSDTIGGTAADFTGEGYDASVGLTFRRPLTNRAARARHRRAVLTREQAELALENLEQLAELDVRTALVEAKHAREQIAATRATRKFREEVLRAESVKFRVGDSRMLLVARAQRDLVASQVSEVRAVVGCLKAFVDLYVAEGTLLERRGIAVP